MCFICQPSSSCLLPYWSEKISFFFERRRWRHFTLACFPFPVHPLVRNEQSIVRQKSVSYSIVQQKKGSKCSVVRKDKGLYACEKITPRALCKPSTVRRRTFYKPLFPSFLEDCFRHLEALTPRCARSLLFLCARPLLQSSKPMPWNEPGWLVILGKWVRDIAG